MKLACLFQQRVHMPDKLNCVLFGIFAISPARHDMFVRTVTRANNIPGNALARGGQGPGFLHELSPTILKAVGTTMELSFHEAA